jgi:hypothetical protein
MRGVNPKKIILVVFITGLIWVWADLAQDETLLGVPGAVYVDEAANPGLWITLDEKLSVPIKMVLSGPVSKTSDVERSLEVPESDRRYSFRFRFDAVVEGLETTGAPAAVSVLGFLQKNKDLRKMGLKVDSVSPEIITVTVRKLLNRELTIECVDENGNALKSEYIKPEQVAMAVPAEWGGELLKAYVQLTKAQVADAAVRPITVRPYANIMAGVRREAESVVEVKMHPAEPRLKEAQVPTVIGATCSQNLFGRFDLQLLNRDEMPSVIRLRATPEAEAVYRASSFKLLLIIEDVDANATEALTRALVYNFPAEYVRRNEIQAVQPAPEARFKLVPRPTDVERVLNP